MIIYSGTKDSFIRDLIDDGLEAKLEESLKRKMHISAVPNEVRSWRNSLTQMSVVLNDPGIPKDAGIAIEYNIPHTNKRVDMIITGLDRTGMHAAVVIELKQWEYVKAVTDKDAIVITRYGKGEKETTHPSFQAWSYASMISDFNSGAQESGMCLHPCAYLHNYDPLSNDPLFNDVYAPYLSLAPAFIKGERKKLRDFIKRYIGVGDKNLETLMLIDSGKLRPSKSLQDCITSMMAGNREFVMIDSQKVIYEKILHTVANNTGKKKVLIVEGGPGTGKTVLAVNLLVKLIEEGHSASYVSKNQAPRAVYLSKLKGTMKKSRVDFLFKGAGCFVDSPRDAFDVLLTDEAHRLTTKNMYSAGENQIMEIIRSAKTTVFFIDDFQRVTMNDIGSIGEIRRIADQEGAEVETMMLDSQFRCDGSDGYLAWLDNLLGIRSTANFDFPDDFDYDFRVFDDPLEMWNVIAEKNRVNDRSRVVAGYCWNWISDGKNDPDVHDIVIPGTGFNMSWNLGSTGTWAVDAGSMDQIGCIHTCQGLEFDYVGVIIGNDLRYVGGEVITDYTKRAKTDKSLNGLKTQYKTEFERQRGASQIIRNTYRVLMTRGMKGCYVYCTDKALAQHIRDSMHVGRGKKEVVIDE